MRKSKEHDIETICMNKSEICSMYGSTVVEGMHVRVGVGVVVRGPGEAILLENVATVDGGDCLEER